MSETEKMKPYYDHKGITIWHGDCREILPTLPKVDLVLTDPPYGIDYTPINKKWDGSKNDWEKIKGDDVENDFSILFKCSENQVIFGAENFYKQLPFRGRWICWHKRSPIWPENSVQQTSDFELAWMSKTTGTYKFFRCIHGGVINANSTEGNNQKRLHPTEKPIGIIRKCMELFNDVKTTCDPFMGSGTTLVAAKELGRKAIGIEIEEKYCEIAAKRLAQDVLF